MMHLLIVWLGLLISLSYANNDCPDVSVCLAKANQTAVDCQNVEKASSTPIVACSKLKLELEQKCHTTCTPGTCILCFDSVERTYASCVKFYTDINQSGLIQKKCSYLKRILQTFCGPPSGVCPICQDNFCRNGAKCYLTRSSLYKCNCLTGYKGVYCEKNRCFQKPCRNGGTCSGDNTCTCPPEYVGSQCEKHRIGLRQNPAMSCKTILDAGMSRGNGLYWIQPEGESKPAETYCDMQYDGGGWSLASFGYLASTSCDSNNRAIPNMNVPYGYNWLPAQRSSNHGVINLPHGAVYLARGAKYMMMAAAGNPNTGGIDSYTYVYRVHIADNPYTVTFANHNYDHGARGYVNNVPQMHVTNFTVVGLKSEYGTFVTYGLGEALGVASEGGSCSYLTGYGVSTFKSPYYYGNCIAYGPFFPSIHSAGGCWNYLYLNPDVRSGHNNGDMSYVHCGWRDLSANCRTGQMSIWFK